MYRKILVALIGIIILVAIGGGIFLYLDSRVNNEGPNELDLAQELFPQTIYDYDLVGSSPAKIEISGDCRKIEKSSDFRRSGITGEICLKTIRGRYQQTAGNKVVFVILNKITQGKEIYDLIIDEFTTKDRLNNFEIVRFEKSELGWFPIDLSVDCVMTQIGTFKISEDGVSYEYANKAMGNDPVTQYFIGKHPPRQIFSAN